MGRKIEFTDENKEALRGLAPFNPNEKFTFTPYQFNKVGVPEELRPKFTIRTLPKGEHIDICRLFDNIKEAKESDINEAARKITVGWENLFDVATGEEIEFKSDATGACDKETFDLIPRVIRGTLLAKAREISGLYGGEKLGLG